MTFTILLDVKLDSIKKVLPEALYLDKSYRYASIRPEFPGGEDSLKSYTTNYSSDIDSSQAGIITVSVVIDTTGSIKKPQLVYKHSEELNKRALEAISKLPKFKPAYYKGKKVNYRMSIPFYYAPIEWKDRPKNSYTGF